ncbi:MAG: lysophospholipid acyltransferase family protein [Desulfobacterales bacterium]|jgi:1-acyl-sn-glycerol-3-phosphate acyltransferase|nr:lysophospholipid acyltransferase family protein [Desulfobacterales bacterium]
MNKTASFAYQFYKWLIFIPFLGLTTLIFGAAAIALSFFSKRFAGKWCGMLWARSNIYATPAQITVRGRGHLDALRAYVIVANHQSLFDIFVVYGWLGMDLRWIMKKELRKVPVLGLACEKVGHIIVDRSNTEAALASINAAKENITGGTSIVFFPEGTRSRNGRLGAFKKGAFRLALDLGLPILPISISGTKNILPPDGLNLMPGRVTLTIHPPIDLSEYSIENLPELMERTRNAIESAL